MKHLNYILVFLYFICNISTTVLAATKCYQCSTTTKPQCADLADVADVDTCKTTTGNEINCLMYQYKLNGRDITYRGCRKKDDTCEDVKLAIEMEGKEFVTCDLCDTDLCKSGKNGAVLIKFPVVRLLITIAFILTLTN